MSAISSAPAAKSVHDAAEHSPADAPDRSPTPTLITEAEVVFSSAAAVSSPRTRTTGRLTDATRIVAAAVRGMFLTSSAHPRPTRRHYPQRFSYLEDALMTRQMHRL
jgi:hypothetical protein